jgi:hypothetical protein
MEFPEIKHEGMREEGRGGKGGEGPFTLFISFCMNRIA